MRHVGVIGGGAWGTALAIVAVAGGPVTLWTRDPAHARAIEAARENAAYLPGVALPAGIVATADAAMLADCAVLLVAVPAQHVRAVLADMPSTRVLVLCAKGIEAASGRLMAEVAGDAMPGATLAVLSGPTFAIEVARGLPAAITLACADRALGEALAARLARPTFRPYWSDDIVGACVGGAVKNVLAVACGVVLGRELGENARAAVIARGWAEMLRFGLAKGARAETLAGLSGLGDLVLTCTSTRSRNTALGIALGVGERSGEYLAAAHGVAEGAYTAAVLAREAGAIGVDMPITRAVAELIDGTASVDATVASVLRRPLRDEGIATNVGIFDS